MRYASLLLLCAAVGCGYHLAGEPSPHLAAIRSIKIGPLENKSVEHGLDKTLAFAMEREILERGHFRTAYDTGDAALTVEETVVLAVQVNGKVRGRIEVPQGTPDADVLAAALADPAVQAHLEDKPIRRQVVVPGRLVNFVV